MEADRDGNMIPMIKARCTIGFNSEEERIYQAMKAISPKWGWPRALPRVWTIEDQRRYDRYVSGALAEFTPPA
tara:strand:+ start:758 stop:976 length:219 start_codon:yes stop_codon:yes gene_type:complete